jgi:hypothetical protein
MDKNILFIRRYTMIKELIEESFDVIEGDVCDYTFSQFLTEICWRVSDKKELLQLSGIGYNDLIHMWVRNNFHTHIRKGFENLLQKESCFDESLFLNEGDDDGDYM